MSTPRLKPIDLLGQSNGRADLVESAVRMHMKCPECHGRGGNTYYPEDPCRRCGFNFADSYGVEAVMDEIDRKDNLPTPP